MDLLTLKRMRANGCKMGYLEVDWLIAEVDRLQKTLEDSECAAEFNEVEYRQQISAAQSLRAEAEGESEQWEQTATSLLNRAEAAEGKVERLKGIVTAMEECCVSCQYPKRVEELTCQKNAGQQVIAERDAAIRARTYEDGMRDAAGIAEKVDRQCPSNCADYDIEECCHINTIDCAIAAILAAAGNPQDPRGMAGMWPVAADNPTDKESLTVATPKYGTGESELARQGVDMLRGNPATVGEVATCRWRQHIDIPQYYDTDCGCEFEYDVDMNYCPSCGKPISIKDAL